MKIEGNRAHIFHIPRSEADMLYSIFIDLIDGHIKTDIVSRGVFNIFHNGIVCITTDGIMPLPVTIQTQQNQICLWQINGKCAIRQSL